MVTDIEALRHVVREELTRARLDEQVTHKHIYVLVSRIPRGRRSWMKIKDVKPTQTGYEILLMGNNAISVSKKISFDQLPFKGDNDRRMTWWEVLHHFGLV